MTSNGQDPISKLIHVLDCAAMYNDKGHLWCGHDSVKREVTQAAFHQEMLDLVARIGHDALPPELISAIASGAAARDDDGYFSALLQRSR